MIDSRWCFLAPIARLRLIVLFSEVLSVRVVLSAQLLLRSGTTNMLLSLLKLRVAFIPLNLLAHLIDISVSL